MVEYEPGALRQVDDLLRYYEDRQRDGAARALLTALQAAERRIEEQPGAGLPAPRPYPRLARPGVAWIKAGRYWITYTTTSPPVIVGATRGKLNLTDLNIFLEDFFKTTLNHILRLSLVNLNAEHHNASGLDLGDTGKAGRR